MKLSIAIILMAIAMPLFSQNKSLEEAEVVTSDIDLFWKCYDEANGKIKASTFEPYIKEGSQGVQDFIRYRIESAKKLAKTVKKKQKYYEFIRASSLKIKGDHAAAIREVYKKLQDWYPAAVYPNAYFVIGRLNSGGTASDKGIIMGAEMFGPQEEGQKMKANINYDYIPGIVAHELVHFQQYYPMDQSLLAQSIREGAADLIALLLRDAPLKHYTDDWALPKAKTLWEEFEARMDGNNWKGWLYGGSGGNGRPADLGYWMGYQICKAYYDRQADKKQAVKDILNISDFKAFLVASEYAKQFE